MPADAAARADLANSDSGGGGGRADGGGPGAGVGAVDAAGSRGDVEPERLDSSRFTPSLERNLSMMLLI